VTTHPVEDTVTTGERANEGAAVTIVVPSWNGRHLLEKSLPSITRQGRAAARILVVDNGSTDGTVEYLSSEWPGVECIGLPENLGFAAAANAGIRAVSTPFVALVNNDVELEDGWLDAMVEALEHDPGAGYAAGKMMSFFERDTIDDTGTVFTWYATSWNRGKGELDTGQYDSPGYVFGACAGAALYRSHAFERVGPFDEDFFAYAEDTDWALRAQLLGIRCRYTPSAVSYHMGQATSRRMPQLTLRLGFRNTVYLVVKSFPASELVRNAPRLAYWWMKTLYGSVKDGWARAFLSAQVEVFRRLPSLLRKRREIQRARVTDSAYLRSVISVEAPPSHLLSRLSPRRGGRAA
jgi:GT2 family glycosyltransferase